MECHRQEEGEQASEFPSGSDVCGFTDSKLSRCCGLDGGHGETIVTEMVTACMCLCDQPKKKKKPKPQPEASAEPAPPQATPPEDSKDEMNGFHANGSVMDGESLDSLSEHLDSASLDAAELDSEPASSETTGNQSFDKRGLFEPLAICNIWMQQRFVVIVVFSPRLNRRTMVGSLERKGRRWTTVPRSSGTLRYWRGRSDSE